jgi:hypothetical protein
MAPTSPLPRWAPTTGRPRLLWWRWGGGTADAADHPPAGGQGRWWSLGCGEDAAHHEPAGGRGRWWMLGSGIFAWATSAGGRRQQGEPTSNGTACGGVPGSGCELVAPPADAGDPRAFLTWEDVHVTVGGGGPRGAPDVKILDGSAGTRVPGRCWPSSARPGAARRRCSTPLQVRLFRHSHLLLLASPLKHKYIATRH